MANYAWRSASLLVIRSSICHPLPLHKAMPSLPPCPLLPVLVCPRYTSSTSDDSQIIEFNRWTKRCRLFPLLKLTTVWITLGFVCVTLLNMAITLYLWVTSLELFATQRAFVRDLIVLDLGFCNIWLESSKKCRKIFLFLTELVIFLCLWIVIIHLKLKLLNFLFRFTLSVLLNNNYNSQKLDSLPYNDINFVYFNSEWLYIRQFFVFHGSFDCFMGQFYSKWTHSIKSIFVFPSTSIALSRV